LGGDCLNVGCVPSKALISAARVVATVRNAGEFGIEVPDGVRVEFSRVMQRMRRLRAEISPNDSAERFRKLGVDVFLGQASFIADGVIQAGDRRLSFKRAVICTGARASVPPIPGLDRIKCLTNESLFSLTELPARLAVIGGGPIGCEMAQCFARFGSHVALFESAPHVLIREDADAAGIIQQSLEKDGVELLCNSQIVRADLDGSGATIVARVQGEQLSRSFDAVLVAVGRAPNIDGLNLEAVGVQFDPRVGVKVDDNLRTTNSRIFAAGDICFPYKFTHTADFLARIVIQNALFFGRAKASALTIPWCTYTSPELAHVGLSEAEAQKSGVAIQTLVQKLEDVDRAILDGETEGFVKIHVKTGTDKIVGATVVAAHAGDLISEISVAMRNGVGLKGIGATIHPYPTQAEAIRKLGDQFNRGRLTPFVKRLLKTRLRWMS
jgi:pyruvate/2-oxoglutarate dehydrogenase complex dihydrolipoamide dehydrogenase (E3) component